jgi:hypothetical protein
MVFNATTSLWNVVVPGHESNATLEFIVTALDTAGNVAVSSSQVLGIRFLIVGDINADGIVNIFDVVLCANHYQEKWP